MMAFTTDQLDAVRAAYARGVLEATLPDGSRIKYRSLDEMDRVIAKMEQQLNVAPSRKNVIYPTHTRGF